jgi:hypothetical protein
MVDHSLSSDDIDVTPYVPSGAMHPTDTVCADSITWVGVFSDVGGYHLDDFPGGGPPWSQVIANARVATVPPNYPVTMDSTPTGNGAPLTWMPGFDLCQANFGDPPIGSAWETTYVFHCGPNTANLDLSNCTFRALDIPQNVTVNGNTISWDPVQYATNYRLRWYPLDTNGFPDRSEGPVANTDFLDQPTYNMISPVPEVCALRVEAWESCNGDLVNRSSIFVRHDIPPIPSLNQWGIIVLSLIIATTALSIIWRKTRTN